MQQQLAASRIGDVDLRDYFGQPCRSLSASMIHDPEKISVEVDVDDSCVSADASVSLGLVVTELVINALKHAFPGHRNGRILVGYEAQEGDWTLSVRDDDVGMPKASGTSDGAKSGLGTSIVEALARQLKADVETEDADPGTVVSLVHHDGDVTAPALAV